MGAPSLMITLHFLRDTTSSWCPSLSDKELLIPRATMLSRIALVSSRSIFRSSLTNSLISTTTGQALSEFQLLASMLTSSRSWLERVFTRLRPRDSRRHCSTSRLVKIIALGWELLHYYFNLSCSMFYTYKLILLDYPYVLT